uniref:Uncharacterized protein n=1 Tax=Myoviridae sp. ctuIn11 TaxID=2827715 RepID=A0A8S5SIV1_9CAUD|nr:MAG TPA: hypothetical protein [Myoviridae sp. ctuIn11]
MRFPPHRTPCFPSLQRFCACKEIAARSGRAAVLKNERS